MNKIISTHNQSATPTRRSLAKMEGILLSNSSLTDSQIDKCHDTIQNCTSDHPCNTPNCPTCSKYVYVSRTSSLQQVITQSAASNEASFAITITCHDWSIKPPYDISRFAADADSLVCFLQLFFPSHKWNFSYDLDICDNNLFPHIHGTISGGPLTDNPNDIWQTIQLAANFAELKLDVDVQTLTSTNSLQPILSKTATSWSNYQHKMQHISTSATHASRNQLNESTVVLLRALSRVLFCDVQTMHTNHAAVQPTQFALVTGLRKSAKTLATLGLVNMSTSITSLTATTTANSYTFKYLRKLIEQDSTSLPTVRVALNKYVAQDDVNVFTKKLLLLILSHKASITNNLPVLEKIRGCWPTPDNSLSLQHYWNQWLGLLLS